MVKCTTVIEVLMWYVFSWFVQETPNILVNILVRCIGVGEGKELRFSAIGKQFILWNLER